MTKIIFEDDKAWEQHLAEQRNEVAAVAAERDAALATISKAHAILNRGDSEISDNGKYLVTPAQQVKKLLATSPHQ